jgi:NADH dehydrogenase
LSKDFPELNFEDLRILVMELGDRLLPGFPEELSKATLERLQRMQVEVQLGVAVTDIDGEKVTLKSGEQIPAHTLIWAAGVRAVTVLNRAGFQQARQGRVVVQPSLQVPGHPEVFVIGDAAYLEAEGQPLPMVAPVAIQQGKLAAANIQFMERGEPLRAFQYRDPGMLATIGRNAAVARIKGLNFRGFLAWLVWLGVHIVWLIGFRNRLLVLINWAYDYLLYERAVRLILRDSTPERTGIQTAVEPKAEPVPVERAGINIE